jgi:hypothetical protein
MIRRIVAYVFIVFALFALFPYGVDAPLFCVPFIAFLAFVLVAVACPTVRTSRLVLAFKRGGIIGSLLITLVGLASMVAYVRITCGPNKAYAIGAGNFIRQSGFDFSGGPLTSAASWSWHGLAFGHFGTSSATWGGGRVSSAEYWAIWPLLIALVIPTMILWILDPLRFPVGHCQTCGYNLTGNTSGVCPECGKEI